MKIELVLGIIAVVFWVISIQAKKKKNILRLQIIANIFYCAQYFILTGFSAACMNIVSTIRSIVFYNNEKKHKENSKLLLLIFILIIILVAIFTYNGYLSLIPIFIAIIYTYATWQDKVKDIRVIFIILAIVWIYYNYMIGSYISIIGNLFEIISGIISIVRFDLKNKKK